MLELVAVSKWSVILALVVMSGDADEHGVGRWWGGKETKLYIIL